MLIIALFIPWGLLGSLPLQAIWLLISLGSVLHVIFAKVNVLRKKEKREVDLFFGLAKLVAWNPAEGVVIMRNKSIRHVDDNPYDGGGMTIIYPMLGDEVGIRVPLEYQVFEYKDEEVLTKEFIPLKIRGVVRWKIFDLRAFYLNVSNQIGGLTDRRVHFDEEASKLDVAKHLMTLMAEQQTRMVVAQAATGLLVADQIVAALPQNVKTVLANSHGTSGGQLTHISSGTLPVPSSSDDYRLATHGLGGAIQKSITPKIDKYGICLYEVALQEVTLPPEIYAAAKEACAVAYLPMKAQAEAAAHKIKLMAQAEAEAAGRKMKLQAEADVIGPDAVAMREVMASAPAFTVADFLTQWFAKSNFAKTHT